MLKKLFKSGLLASSALLLVAVAVPVTINAQPARAQEAQAEAQTGAQEAREAAEQRREEVQATATEKRQEAKGKLEAAKLRACQNREKAIQNILVRFSDRGTKQLEVFSTIADRTQAFYAEQGNTAANYEELLENVNSKKVAAESAVAAVSDNSTRFNCEADNPKEAVNSFKSSLMDMNSALQEYKVAVKDLIVGVKSAQSTTETSTEEIQ